MRKPRRFHVSGASLAGREAPRQWPLFHSLMEDPRATFRIHGYALIPTNQVARQIFREHPHLVQHVTIRTNDPDHLYSPVLMPGRQQWEDPIFRRWLPGGSQLDELLDSVTHRWENAPGNWAQPDLPFYPKLMRLWPESMRYLSPLGPSLGRILRQSPPVSQRAIPEIVESLAAPIYVPKAYEFTEDLLDDISRSPGFRARIHGGRVVIPLNDWTDVLLGYIHSALNASKAQSYEGELLRVFEPDVVLGRLPGRTVGTGPEDEWAQRLEERLLRRALMQGDTEP